MSNKNDVTCKQSALMRRFAFCFVVLCVLILFTIWHLVKLPQRRVLFFPGENAMRIEIHFLPHKWKKEEQLKEFVKELLLGPFLMKSTAVFPKPSKLRFLILKDQVAYIDISTYIGKNIPKHLYPLSDDVKSYMEKNVFYNFPIIKHIYFTIGGQLPGYLPYTIENG